MVDWSYMLYANYTGVGAICLYSTHSATCWPVSQGNSQHREVCCSLFCANSSCLCTQILLDFTQKVGEVGGVWEPGPVWLTASIGLYANYTGMVDRFYRTICQLYRYGVLYVFIVPFLCCSTPLPPGNSQHRGVCCSLFCVISSCLCIQILLDFTQKVGGRWCLEARTGMVDWSLIDYMPTIPVWSYRTICPLYRYGVLYVLIVPMLWCSTPLSPGNSQHRGVLHSLFCANSSCLCIQILLDFTQKVEVGGVWEVQYRPFRPLSAYYP